MLEGLKSKLRSYRKIALLLLAFFFCLSLVRNVKRISEAKKAIEEAQARIDRLKQENEEIEDKLAIAQSQEFVEKQLRDKLGLAKEGEVVLVLPDKETLKKIVPSVPEEEETLPDPNWKKWFKLFF